MCLELADRNWTHTWITIFIVVLCFVLLGQGHIGMITEWHRIIRNVRSYNNVLYSHNSPWVLKMGEVLGVRQR